MRPHCIYLRWWNAQYTCVLARWQVISSLSEIIKSNYITRNLCNYSRLFTRVVLSFFLQIQFDFFLFHSTPVRFFSSSMLILFVASVGVFVVVFFSLASTNLIILNHRSLTHLRYSFQRPYLSFLVADIFHNSFLSDLWLFSGVIPIRCYVFC